MTGDQRPASPFRAMARMSSAPVPLICPAGVGEAVADHPVPNFQRGPDGALQMIGARGEHQQGLGHRGPARGVAVQGDGADVLGPGRTARFAGLDHLKIPRAQAFDQPRRLGRLAGSLAALECDESALGHRRTMAAPDGFARV